jgi:hypothetical protein
VQPNAFYMTKIRNVEEETSTSWKNQEETQEKHS